MLTCLLLLMLFIENSSASSNACTNNHEIGAIRQEISLLRDENKEQNMEISLLKEMIKSQDKTMDKKIIEKLDQRMKYDESSAIADLNQHSSVHQTRQKRPYRLIPKAHKNRFEESNILNEHQKTGIFYGPPTNCSDLSRLGYTLNGYYLVKRVTDTSNNEATNLEAVYCSFKQPPEGGSAINLSTEEKRIGLLKFLDDHYKSESSFDGNLNSKGLTVMKINPPRMSNRINGLGKCAAISYDAGKSSSKQLVHWDCNQYQKGMLWSWNETTLGSGDRHLCNGHGKCAASRANSPSNGHLIQLDHHDQKDQRYHFLHSPTRPGFYSIKNDHGKCISVNGNTRDRLIYTKDCNSSDDGQNWKWRNL